jgi:hypothetical protein
VDFIDLLRYASQVAIILGLGGIFATARSKFGEVLNRLLEGSPQRLDYLYLFTFLIISILGFLWFFEGNNENEQINYWIRPKYFQVKYLFVHALLLLCIGSLFYCLFYYLPEFGQFTKIFVLYVVFDILQWIFKRIELDGLFSVYSQKLKLERALALSQDDSEATKIVDIELQAIEALHAYYFTNPTIALHVALLVVVFLLHWKLAPRTTVDSRIPRPKIIVIGYVTLILALVLHEVVIWSWRDQMFSKLRMLRSQLCQTSLVHCQRKLEISRSRPEQTRSWAAT